MAQRLLWIAGLVVLAAVLGAVFDDWLSARGIGPHGIFSIALLTAVLAGWWGPLPRNPAWVLAWLMGFAALGLAYAYVPGLAAWFDSR